MKHTSSILHALFQKRQAISILTVVMILLTLGVSVTFTRLHPAHAANAITWSSNASIKQASSRSPAMTAFQGKLYVAYVAYVAPDPDDIGRLYVTTSSDGITWPADGTFTNLNALMDHKNVTSISPALTVFNNKLYMAYVADYSYQLMIASSSDGTTWSPGTPILNQYTDATPALAVYNNKLFIAFVANNKSNSLLIASYDGTNWSGDSQVSNSSITQYSYWPPSLAVYNNKLYVAFVAANSSGNVLIASYDGTNWSNDTNINQVTRAAPALIVYNNELLVVFADNGLHDHLLYISSDGTNWPASTWVPDQYTSSAPVMAVLNNKLYIAYLANSRDLFIVSGSSI
jgi:hypothetical protein